MKGLQLLLFVACPASASFITNKHPTWAKHDVPLFLDAWLFPGNYTRLRWDSTMGTGQSWTLPDVFLWDPASGEAPPPPGLLKLNLPRSPGDRGNLCLEVGELTASPPPVEYLNLAQLAPCDEHSAAQLWTPFKSQDQASSGVINVCNPASDSCLMYRQMEATDPLIHFVATSKVTADSITISEEIPTTSITTSTASPGSWYKSITPASNPDLCLDVPGDDVYNGAPLWLWECDGGEAQRWVFDNWQIRFGADETKCVDAGGSGTGLQLYLSDCEAVPSQKWGFDFDTHRVYLPDSSYCLDFYADWASNGQPAHIWDCTGDWNQEWSLWDLDSQTSKSVISV